MLKRILWMMCGMVLAVVVAGVVYLVWAGSIDSSQGPDNVASRMYTLKNIYDYLTDVDNPTLPSKSSSATFVEPSAGPASTMNTTDNIFENLVRFPATGQTTSYPNGNDADRDDGYYEKGATKKYGHSTDSDKLPDGTDIPDGVTYDYNTGLMWEQKTAANKDTTYTWENAQTYCEDQIGTSGTYAGHDDWRLPNAYELYSICKLENTIGAPYIDTTYFLNTQSGHYWSSTTTPDGTASALYVDFSNGYVISLGKGLGSCVRAVRLGH